MGAWLPCVYAAFSAGRSCFGRIVHGIILAKRVLEEAGVMRHYALLGEKLGHSYSVPIH